jgi:hypothetical protein
MTDEQLNNTLCLVVVSYKPDPYINTTRSFSLYRSVKEATSLVADTKKPHEEVALYTTDEERLLIAIFPREETKT